VHQSNANVHGVRYQKTRWEPARTTASSLSYLPETNYWYPADTVLLATGEQTDLSLAPEVKARLAHSAAGGRNNWCAVLPGVFVAGEAARSSPDQRSLQHALSGGYEVAHLIHHFLQTDPAMKSCMCQAVWARSLLRHVLNLRIEARTL
jgi:hypothetical protein